MTVMTFLLVHSQFGADFTVLPCEYFLLQLNMCVMACRLLLALYQNFAKFISRFGRRSISMKVSRNLGRICRFENATKFQENS